MRSAVNYTNVAQRVFYNTGWGQIYKDS